MEMLSRKRSRPSQEGEFSIRMTMMTKTYSRPIRPHDNPLLFHPPRITLQMTTTTNPLKMSTTSTRKMNSAPQLSSPTSAKPVSKPSPPNAPPKLVLKKNKTRRNQPPQNDLSRPFDQSVDRQRLTDGNQRHERLVRRLWMKCNAKLNGWQGTWAYDRKSRLQRKL